MYVATDRYVLGYPRFESSRFRVRDVWWSGLYELPPNLLAQQRIRELESNDALRIERERLNPKNGRWFSEKAPIYIANLIC